MLQKLTRLVRDANISTRETYKGVHWVFAELVSSEARRLATWALTYLVLSVACFTLIPFTLKFVFDAYNVGDTTSALWALVLVLISSGGAVEFGTRHDVAREKMWNRNYFTIRTNLIWKLFTRSREEVLGEKSEFSVEQVESTKDRAQNILYLLFFEAPVVVAMIVLSTIFVSFIDVASAALLAGLTVVNIVWFYLFNTIIDDIMVPIDKKFRSESRRSSERVNMYATVTAHGVEEKMLDEVRVELTEPLNEDLAFWAQKFPKVDVWRRRINAVVPVAVLALCVWRGAMTVGDLSAVGAWAFAISREYGFIGHLMRHLTSQVSRIKAAREALSTPSVLETDGSVIYERRI